MENLEDIRKHRGRLRRESAIDAVLALCEENHVTLVELEDASKVFVSRYEEIQAGLQDNRRKAMYSHRARHAARTRWERARKFLTSHLDRKEYLEKTLGPIEIDLGDLVETPKPARIYDDGVS